MQRKISIPLTAIAVVVVLAAGLGWSGPAAASEAFIGQIQFYLQQLKTS